MYWLPALLVLAIASSAHAQSTAQSSVAPELRECYTDPHLQNRNNLPPTTIPVLIDIIRKIENNPNINLDLRMLAARMLHTYRQDGIEFHQRNNAGGMVLPYAPTFHSFHRHRLLLRIVSSNQQVLPNNTLPSTLKCALHHMLSTTVDARVRGDENNCGQLSQYRAMRTSRFSRSARSIDDDVEILDMGKLGADKNGQINQYNTDFDVDNAGSSRQLQGDSACPILTGAVNTHWGAVSAGNLITGIAAGTETQQVPILELTKGTVLNYQNVQPFITTVYPATLSGELAEAVLIQGTAGSSSITIGNTGNWNSSQATRYYMLSGRTNLEMTDPEIRGALDGFFLGTTITDTLRTFSGLKLSQLIDMYYSPMNGAFNPALRACNRHALGQQNIPISNLLGETRAFAAALDTIMPLTGTLTGGLEGLVASAVNNFQTYINTNLNDQNCLISESTRIDTRSRTNLYIALDASWQYQIIYPAITYLLDSIEVGVFGSSITLLSALDGSVLINKTFSPADFHTEYTIEMHQSFMTGVNLQTSFANIRWMLQDDLRNETNSNYVGGNSTVLLFLLNNNIENNANVAEEARLTRLHVPDLKVLFATANNQADNLANLVLEPANDIMTISLSSTGLNIDTAMRQVLVSIQSVGRRVINPLCGADFAAGSSGSRQFTEYVDPGYVNFYRVSPYYFFSNNENARVRVSRTGAGVGSLIVCQSRVVSVPRQNATFASVDSNAVTCETLTAGNVDIILQNACGGHINSISCPPLFFSVEAPPFTSNPTPTCTDAVNCRFPYDIAYQIQIDEFGCFSHASGVVASTMFVLLGIIVNMFRNL